MLANTTKPRPADLPEFANPPLTEVVLGVQFNALDQFLSPHLGVLWADFRSRFPNVEEHVPLPPAFETFGPNPQFLPFAGLQISAAAEMPRIFFINGDRTELLQVQRDRFLHNWRKVKIGGEYPRFERMLSTFIEGINIFETFLKRQSIGTISPNQVELTYINQIPTEENGTLFELVEALFPKQSEDLRINELGAPEDVRFLLRYIMRDKDAAPIGRLIVSAEPARREDGMTILQFSLTARGKPATPDIASVVDFLEVGRAHVVRTFTNITSPRMQKKWARTQ